MLRNATVRRVRRGFLDVLLGRPARWLVEYTRATLLMFARPGDSINYTASVQVNLQCDRAILDTLNGRDFYRLLAEDGLAAFESQGLAFVECNVKASHLRRIRRDLAHRVHIRVMRTSLMGHTEMSWIEIRKKGAGDGAAR
jgi:hypothetical protein